MRRPSPGNDSTHYRRYMTLKREVSSYTIGTGQCEYFGNARIYVLSGNDRQLPQNSNSQSLVLKVTNKLGGEKCSIILTGDCDVPTLKRVCQLHYDLTLKADVFMAPHHGSRGSLFSPNTSSPFSEPLQRINPIYTIVSVGDNPHGHPHPQALRLLRKYGNGYEERSKLFRTDQHGNIKIIFQNNGEVRVIPQNHLNFQLPPSPPSFESSLKNTDINPYKIGLNARQLGGMLRRGVETPSKMPITSNRGLLAELLKQESTESSPQPPMKYFVGLLGEHLMKLQK